MMPLIIPHSIMQQKEPPEQFRIPNCCLPLVWVSNQFTNNGLVNGTYSVGGAAVNNNPITNPAGLTYNVDPYGQPLPGEPPLGSIVPSSGAINVVDENFKFPQVFRANLAIDK